MNKLTQFVQEHSADILTSPERPSTETIRDAEKLLGFTFGEQLKSYLETYGFLIYQFIELHGLSERQKMSSDIVVHTQRARENFSGLDDVVIIESFGGGNFIVCDEHDQVYEYLPNNSGKRKDLQKTFDEYVVSRFNEIA